MKHSYYERAIHFLHQIAPFVDDWGNYFSIIAAIQTFNTTKSRKVLYNSGMTRHCLITSDYVVKWDKTEENARYWLNNFGGVHSEIAFYKVACNDGRGHLFAEALEYHFQDVEFEIMPRVDCLGMDRGTEACDVFDEDDWDYIETNVLDVHDENFGYLHGVPIVIDYAGAYETRR